MDDPLLAPTTQPLVVPVQRRLMAWGPDGGPMVTTAPLVTQAQIKDLYAAVAALPFECEDPFHPDFVFNGLPIIEVMVRRQIAKAAQAGSEAMVETVIDRLIGRPMQSTETKRVNINYEDWLRETARKESLKQAIPATPVDPINGEFTP